MFDRTITWDIINNCFLWKWIIIYWPRQVGKTTITKQIQKKFTDKNIYYATGDDLDIQQLWEPRISVLSNIVSGYDIVIIDEAQRIKNIWLVLKLLIDTYPEKQFIATWSSSFDLANKVSEPLTWRTYIYHLYPLSLWEIYNGVFTKSILEQRMTFWSYPDVINTNNINPSQYLKNMVDNYLYKDILWYDGIQKYDIIIKLLQALALQIWNEFSILEIANTIWSNKDTVTKYINILEQAFIIKTLSPLHTNQRREIKSHKKVYFWDLWIRNALINNFNPMHIRNDVWQLWENLCFIERTKYISYNHILHNQYFWREASWLEIDYIEQYNDKYDCREFKYSTQKWWSLPSTFATKYICNKFEVIRNDNINNMLK